MAEAFAVVGIVASIVQLVDFSTKVINRLEEFQSTTGEIPKSFRHIKNELPVLSTALQNISRVIESGSIDTATRDALHPVINGCREQITQLDIILAKTLPNTKDKWLTKSKKAVVSLGQEDKVEKMTKILRNYVATLTFYHTAAASTLQPLQDSRLIKIRDWLSAPDPSTNYQEALKQRQNETGLWFIESNQYLEWKNGVCSSLWLHGIPGCGKTILSSTILQNVLEHCKSDPGKVVAYFFFDFNDTRKQSSELMVRSLVCQLSQQCVKIPKSLDTLISSCGNGQQQPPLHALLEVLQQMISEVPNTYIVLDALDECPPGGRTELINILEIISAWKLQNLHILMTSRRERDIESSLETFIREQDFVSLQSKLVDRDIHKYVRHRLSADKQLIKWGNDPARRQDIEEALMKGAQGMFRWAACQLDTLRNCRTRASLRKTLEELPPTLDETYNRILSAISEADKQYAVPILRWLAFSIRPLTADELAEVVAIDLKEEARFDPEEVLEDPLDVLSICSSLVAVTTEEPKESTFWHGGDEEPGPGRQIIVLAHYSVKEYLISDRIRKGSAACYHMQNAACHDAIARSCLGYLLQFEGTMLLSDDNAEDFKLAEYSAEFWIEHTQATGEESTGYIREATVILCEKEDTYTNWLRIHVPDQSRPYHQWHRNLKSVPAPLYYASYAGLTTIVKQLLDQGADVNARGEWVSAAQIASQEGHEEVVKLLLAHNADIKLSDKFGGSALYAASQRGHEHIVKLLLEHGADIDAYVGYGNALGVALGNGHKHIAKLLLKNNANVNLEGGYETPLQIAARKSDIEMVKLLLEKNADVKDSWEYHPSPLYSASANGNEQIVRLLLERNANVNALAPESMDNCSALEIASQNGHEHIVKILLENDADINTKTGLFSPALLAASTKGHEQIVKLLVEKNAEINPYGGHQTSALYGASKNGHEKIVKLLLENNTEVDAQGPYNAATWAASSRGHVQILEVLLEGGVDFEMHVDDYHGNALHVASAGGRKEVVKLLLAKGANVNARGGHYDNALQAASARGHEEVVKLLIEQGAYVNAQGGMHQSALQAASVYGHEEIVKLLLKKGANVNAQGSLYGNALQGASVRGHVEIVQLLLNKGADINAQGGYHSTALEAASYGGHKQTVELLLGENADPNVQHEDFFSSALQVAAVNGHDEVIKLLLEEGANIDAQGGHHGTTLGAATGGGHRQTVKLLLGENADPNVQYEGYYGNALQAASAFGYDEVVKLLLEKGADVGAQGGQYNTALEAASYEGHKQTVELLLKTKTDGKVQELHHSALAAARREGHEQIVKLLLENYAEDDEP